MIKKNNGLSNKFKLKFKGLEKELMKWKIKINK